MNCVYVSSTDNEWITLLSPNEKNYVLQNPEELFKYEWQYSGIESSTFGGEIKRFSKSFAEYTLTVSVVCNSQEDFAQKVRYMTDMFDTDIKNMTPGRLSFNDSYLECYIKASNHVEYDDLFYMADIELTVLTAYPMWLANRSWAFSRWDEDNQAILGFAILNSAVLGTESGTAKVHVTNTAPTPCDAQIIISGPVENPLLQIGDNCYQVYCTLEKNDILKIDTKAKTVLLNSANYFSHRNYNYDIFAKISSGTSEVKYSGDSKVRVELLEGRSQPSWN